MVNNQMKTFVVPTFGDNLKFFFEYQIGWMYMRYFMWNFVGRQNDIQGHGDRLHGNWISGISFIDDARLGDQSDLPIELQGNKGHNTYFFLPLLLGLLGLVFQMQRHYKDGIVVIALFIMTGLAIVVYLNQYPYQPRERDYAYVASFYAFAIWIGLGVLALYEGLRKIGNPAAVAGAITLVTLILVPGVMAQQNWDDHDRSGRYNTLNVANNYLNSCAPNAILFTNGDNDTFPLWYAQEVEGIRTDIKIVNLSLFNTDWYVDQMRRKTYDADPIPLNIGRDKYIQGTNDYAYMFVDKRIRGINDKNYIDLKKIMNFFFSGKNKLKYNDGVMRNYIPTKRFYLDVDSATVVDNGTVALKDTALIVDKIKWSVGKSVVQKNDLMMMEMLASFNWNRPVYYAITTGADTYLGLTHYFQLDGLAYRLVPIYTKQGSIYGSYGRVNTDILYDNIMHKFRYDGLNDPNIYFDEHHMRSIRNYRSNFVRLANALLDEGKNEKAKKVLDKCMETLPEYNVPYDYFMIPIAEGYYRMGETDKANEIIKRLIEIFDHDLAYYFNNSENSSDYYNEKRNALFILQETSNTANKYEQTELGQEANAAFMRYAQIFQQRR
jgi:tetratricopeptide (TPR) repeat protein